MVYKHKKIDDLIVKKILSGKNTFKLIFSAVNTRTAVYSEQLIDSRLQFLRRKDRIGFDHWERTWYAV